MNFKASFLAARRTASPDAEVSDASSRGRAVQKQASSEVESDVDLAARQPKRSSSFGRSLGGSLQSLTNGMNRASESLSRKTSGPGSDGVRTPPTAAPRAEVQARAPDASHLPQFSLRLSELVNRCFTPCTPAGATAVGNGSLAGAAKAAVHAPGSNGNSAPQLSAIVYEGRRLPNRAVINEIAATLTTELDFAAGHGKPLLRAVARSALKALTLFADRFDSLIVTPTKDPNAIFVPTSAKDGMHPPAAVEYNLGLASLEWVVEDALEGWIEGANEDVDDSMLAVVSDILSPVRKKMTATIDHIVEPLMDAIRTSAKATLLKLEPAPFSGNKKMPSPGPSHGAAVASPGVSSPAPPFSPPANASSAIKELEGKLEGIRRLLEPRLVQRCGADGECWYIRFLVHVVWKGLMILTSRDVPPPAPLCSQWPMGLQHSSTHALASDLSKRSPSPAQLSSALRSVSRVRKGQDGKAADSGGATPCAGQTAAQVAAALVNASNKATAAQIADLQALERFVLKLSAAYTQNAKDAAAKDGYESGSSSDEEDDEREQDQQLRLARGALAEALRAIKNTIVVIQHLDNEPDALLTAACAERGTAPRQEHSIPAEAVRAVRVIPPLLFLHLLFTRMPLDLGVFATTRDEHGKVTAPAILGPPATFGLTWAEYEKSIGGFGSAGSWAPALIKEWVPDLEEAWRDLAAREKAMGAKSREKQASNGLFIPLLHTAQADDVDEATPTRESYLLKRTLSAHTQPMSSSPARSSESLQQDLTSSTVSLQQDKPKEGLAENGSRLQNGRSSWTRMKGLARSAASSGASSPAPTPEASPPRSPVKSSPEAAATNGSRTNPRARFWRTASSNNTRDSTEDSMSASKTSLMSLSSRGKSASSDQDSLDAASTATYGADDRYAEELRLERASLVLFSHGLKVAAKNCGLQHLWSAIEAASVPGTFKSGATTSNAHNSALPAVPGNGKTPVTAPATKVTPPSRVLAPA